MMTTDALSYLKEAALSLIARNGVSVTSKEAVVEWMKANRQEVIEEARQRQTRMFASYQQNRNEVKAVLASKIYHSIKRNELTRRENETYAAILA